MPTKIKTTEGDLLQRISEENHFQTMELILQANPGLAERIVANRGVLPGNIEITIPDKEKKNEQAATGNTHTFRTGPGIDQLKIKIEYIDENNKTLLDGWEYRLNIKRRGEGIRLKTGKFDESTIIQVENLPNNEIYDGELRISKNIGASDAVEINIELNIYPFCFFREHNDHLAEQNKDLDNRNRPLFHSHRVSANKWIDVDHDRKFTDPVEPPITQRNALGSIKLKQKRFIVFLQAADINAMYAHNVVKIDYAKFVFLDTGRWLLGGRDFGVIWGKHVYLCSYKTPNAETNLNAMGFQRNGGLDRQFFEGFGETMRSGDVQVTKCTTVDWADEEEFDWDHIYIIIPDMHLMTADRLMKWRDTYCSDDDKTNELRTRLSERMLAEFIDRLMNNANLQGKIRLIQIGDLYDLWVGYGENNRDKLYDKSTYDYIFKERSETKLFPLFKDRIEQQDIVLDHPEADTEKIAGWINEIRGSGDHANPALKALTKFTDQYPGSSFYIYGNHDSYLKLRSVCEAGGLPERKMHLNDFRSIFIEHGQRMEKFFSSWTKGLHIVTSLGDRFPGNSDGDTSGFIVTNVVYLSKVNEGGIVWGALASFIPGLDVNDATTKFFSEGGSIDDETKKAQGQYAEEHAAIWVHRQTANVSNCPHVFVIGHTHMPELFVCAVKLS